MPIVALKFANFRDPVAIDRYSTEISTCAIASDEWHLEANYHFGSIGDVSLYRNTNVRAPGSPPNWQWYGAIPTANIKSYSLMEPPAAQALPVVAVEPQAPNPKKETSPTSAPEKRA